MELTPTPESVPEKKPAQAILDRTAEPFAIFSAALAVLLIVAQVVVLPLFNRFEVDGEKLKPKELSQYRSQLVQQVTEAENARDDLIMPVKDETYLLLQKQKDAQPVFAPIKSAIESAARETQGDGTIVFLRFHMEGRTVTVRGDVQAGVSSMTVLAAFVEKVEQLSFVDTFTRPDFSREEDADIGPHSPFVFSFTLAE